MIALQGLLAAHTFNINLSQRHGEVLLVEHIELLRNAVGTVLRYAD